MNLEPLHRTVPAQPEVVGRLRRELVSYAEDAGVADPHGLALAVSETVTNAILHAYVGSNGDAGPIEVHAEADERELRLTVRDFGRGMVPRTDSPGLGLGLPLLAHFTEHFEVRDAPGGGTSICMVFARTG